MVLRILRRMILWIFLLLPLNYRNNYIFGDNMNSPDIISLILDLGNLKIYSVKQADPTSGTPAKYLWQDTDMKTSYGHFNTVYDTLKHFENFKKSSIAPTLVIESLPKIPNKVVNVDFVTRKRLS